MPLSETSDPPAAPSPTKSITVNYSGLHYVHFTADDPNLSEEKTVGFLITPTDSSLSKTEAEAKKGYITRKFTEAKKSRNVFMFLHEGTAYDLATGCTDIPFVAGGTASNTNFETSDILQENTSYKIRMYDGETILEKTFTTKSFSDGDAGSTGVIGYMGGLTAAKKADVSLTIERKAAEIMLLPYADDTFEGQTLNYYMNTLFQASCFHGGGCGTGVAGTAVYAPRLEANKLSSSVYILSPQRGITPANWSAREGSNPDVVYNTEIISE
ncbi:hypothetical protein P0082_01965 [Candidatus Haliotispira prima]|uniref:IgGFc-binding protein N-terminal domain-containing protein n=1 Tax=Candidatus Haliotispira prima TaxID=3034016 RepID=A0ABY8MI14_9SPIO|nr:hypothetical protein P0082_01965 [Candidatus Haliotispira prima]